MFDRLYRGLLKRAIDVAAAAAALIVLSPLLLLACLAIWLEDGLPCIFRQERVGRDAKPFILLKFRSMPVNTPHLESAEGTSLKVTRVGALLRRTNLDEIPQLFNILRGDMSLVGPRPGLPSQTGLMHRRIEDGSIHCRPGLTGLAQINSYDGMSWHEKAGWDSEYLREMSLRVDLSIIFKTFGYLLKRPPVY